MTIDGGGWVSAGAARCVGKFDIKPSFSVSLKLFFKKYFLKDLMPSLPPCLPSYPPPLPHQPYVYVFWICVLGRV